jgi:hypothetical protein
LFGSRTDTHDPQSSKLPFPDPPVPVGVFEGPIHRFRGRLEQAVRAPRLNNLSIFATGLEAFFSWHLNSPHPYGIHPGILISGAFNRRRHFSSCRWLKADRR